MSTGKQRQQGRQLKKVKVRRPLSQLNLAFILRVWSDVSFVDVWWLLADKSINGIHLWVKEAWFLSHKQNYTHKVCTLNAHIPIFHFSSALRDDTLVRYSWHSVAERCWGNSRKASVSPFVCLLISVSFSGSGHKSGTFAFRQLLERLLGIWLETAESNGRERGERRNPNKWTSETCRRHGERRGKVSAEARRGEPAGQSEAKIRQKWGCLMVRGRQSDRDVVQS